MTEGFTELLAGLATGRAGMACMRMPNLVFAGRMQLNGVRSGYNQLHSHLAHFQPRSYQLQAELVAAEAF